MTKALRILGEERCKKWRTLRPFYLVKKSGGTGDGENQESAVDGGR